MLTYAALRVSYIDEREESVNGKSVTIFYSVLDKGGETIYNWNGDLVDVVVPYMAESITDGKLEISFPWNYDRWPSTCCMVFCAEPGDKVEVDEPIAQVKANKIAIDVSSPEAGLIQKLIAKEGDTVEPGTKVAIISKSAKSATHVASSDDKPSDKAAPKIKRRSQTQRGAKAQSGDKACIRKA